MNILWVLIVIFLLLAIFGNPHLGGHIYPGYSYGYWPGGVGLVVVVILAILLLR